MDSSLASPSVGLRVLRLTPLILATCGFMCGIDQTTSIRPFAADLQPKTGGPALSQWFPGFFRRIGVVVATTHPIAMVTGLINCFAASTTLDSWLGGTSAALSPTSRYLYAAGAAFSFSHFFYGPYAMGVIGQICDQSLPGEKTVELAGTWMKMNRIRLMTVNFWSFFLFFSAVVSIM